MPDFRGNNNQNNEKSTLAVIMEIMKLLGLLCLKGLKKLWKIILKGLKFLLKWIVKGIIFIIDSIDKACKKLKQFWSDNDTQQKRRKLLNAIKKGAIKTLKGIGVAILLLFKVIGWLLKKSFIAILHLKTTLKIAGKWIASTAGKFWKWIAKLGENTKNSFKKFKYNYKSFRRNQGFKGLLFDLRNGLKGKITQFIEKEQDEEDGQEEDENVNIMTDTEVDDNDAEVTGIKRLGRKMYRAMKNISDIK